MTPEESNINVQNKLKATIGDLVMQLHVSQGRIEELEARIKELEEEKVGN